MPKIWGFFFIDENFVYIILKLSYLKLSETKNSFEHLTIRVNIFKLPSILKVFKIQGIKILISPVLEKPDI